MKVRENWLLNEYKENAHPDTGVWEWAPVKGSSKPDIDIPDDWVILVNQKHQISDRGRYMHLTRVGWIANRDEIKRIWSIEKLITWDDFEIRMEASLMKIENEILAELKRVAVQLAVMEKYLAANIKLRV